MKTPTIIATAALIVGSIGVAIAMSQAQKETRSEAVTGGTPAAQAKTDGGADAIRPFRVHYPDEALADLKRRVAATRWPERETVADQSQGVQLATVPNLPPYWGTEYD